MPGWSKRARHAPWGGGALGAALWAAVLLAAPAPAAAAIIPFGSNLSHPADRIYENGQDTTLWPATLGPFSAAGSAGAGPTVPAVPASGQVLEVSVRGRVGDPPSGQPAYGSQPIRFQDLRPLAHGSVRVITTSQAFMLPDRDGIHGYQPVNLCVRQGDFIGLSEQGGFQPTRAPHGIPFQVLASVDGSSTQAFSKHLGVGNGAVLDPTPLSGAELLVQVDLGTGLDASKLCPGGRQGTSARLESSSGPVSGATAGIDIGCHSSFPCSGTVLLQTLPASGARVAPGPGRAAAATLGRARFSLGAFKSKVVRVRLRRRARALLRSHHRRLRVRLRVTVTSGALQTTLLSPLTLRGG